MKKSNVDAPRPEHSPSPTPREHSIERLLSLLENATEGSWHLDRDIAMLEREKIGDCADDEVPPYTTSLDAALTLVPEGWFWTASSAIPLQQRHWPAEAKVYRSAFDKPVIAATAPLALVIAALKARSAK